MSKEDTLPKLLLRNYKRHGRGKIAMRFKDYGIWNEISWDDYYQNVKYISLGLVSMGFDRADKVSIIGDNNPEWFWAELAAQAAGGTSVGIFVDCLPQELKYIVDHSDSKFIFAKDQEQIDKFLSIKDELPKVKKAIYWDQKGLRNYSESSILSFQELTTAGRKLERENPGYFEKCIDSGKGNDIAIISYTSGTTGLPKGAEISFRSLIETTSSWFELDPWREDDDYLSYIPPSWVTEQYLGVVGGLVSELYVNFPEKPETVQNDIREISPVVLMFGARLWESIVSTIQAKINDSGFFRRFSYKLGLDIGYKALNMGLGRGNLSPLWRFLYLLADIVVFRPLKDKFGLKKIRYAYTAGAAVSPDVIRFFHAIGVNLKQLYGLTETGINACHPDNDVAFGTVGIPLQGSQIKIGSNGEILIKSDSMFAGYYKNLEATAKTVIDGWFHTGDAGHINEDGHLVYLDRISEMQYLKGGITFSPQFLETRLRFSPYIQDVLVIGDERFEYVTAIITISFDNVGSWSESKHINYTTFADLSQKDEIVELIKSDVRNVNKLAPKESRINKFLLLHKEFDADEAELTRTRKLKRESIKQRYSTLIEGMYNDLDEVSVDANVTYRDGRTGVIKTSIKISTVG